MKKLSTLVPFLITIIVYLLFQVKYNSPSNFEEFTSLFSWSFITSQFQFLELICYLFLLFLVRIYFVKNNTTLTMFLLTYYYVYYLFDLGFSLLYDLNFQNIVYQAGLLLVISIFMFIYRLKVGNLFPFMLFQKNKLNFERISLKPKLILFGFFIIAFIPIASKIFFQSYYPHPDYAILAYNFPVFLLCLSFLITINSLFILSKVKYLQFFYFSQIFFSVIYLRVLITSDDAIEQLSYFFKVLFNRGEFVTLDINWLLLFFLLVFTIAPLVISFSYYKKVAKTKE